MHACDVVTARKQMKYIGLGQGKKTSINPLPPSDAVRKQKKNILEDLFSSILSQFKKYHPSGNLKFNNLIIFQNLKLSILMEKVFPISLELNFTPNTAGCYGLIRSLPMLDVRS